VVPGGPIHLHVDLDVVDPGELRGLRFPAPGGPDLDAVAGGVATVAATGRVVGLSIAATWDPAAIDPAEAHRTVSTILAAGTSG
jgi:arginase